MSLIEEKARQLARLRSNPAAPAPAFRATTVRQLHHSKLQQRAFDDARLQLKLTTTAALQRKNAAVKVDPKAHRVIRFAQYA